MISSTRSKLQLIVLSLSGLFDKGTIDSHLHEMHKRMVVQHLVGWWEAWHQVLGRWVTHNTHWWANPAWDLVAMDMTLHPGYLMTYRHHFWVMWWHHRTKTHIWVTWLTSLWQWWPWQQETNIWHRLCSHTHWLNHTSKYTLAILRSQLSVNHQLALPNQKS